MTRFVYDAAHYRNMTGGSSTFNPSILCLVKAPMELGAYIIIKPMFEVKVDIICGSLLIIEFHVSCIFPCLMYECLKSRIGWLGLRQLKLSMRLNQGQEVGKERMTSGEGDEAFVEVVRVFFI